MFCFEGFEKADALTMRKIRRKRILILPNELAGYINGGCQKVKPSVSKILTVEI